MSADRQVEGWPRIWRISPLTNELEWRVPDMAGWKMFPWRQEDVEYLQAMTAAARDREGLEARIRELEAALREESRCTECFHGKVYEPWTKTWLPCEICHGDGLSPRARALLSSPTEE